MIAVGVGTIPGFARLIRGQILARASSTSWPRALLLKIVARHILPGLMAPVVVYGTLAIAAAILVAPL